MVWSSDGPGGTISVRISGSATAGAVSGNISLATTGLGSAVTVAVSGTVSTPALSLSLSPTAVNEDAGATASIGTVGIPTALSSNLTVSLVSSNTAAATVPSTVTITNGQTNATFAIAAVANTNSLANQTAGITASASGYTSASATLTVNNVDASYLSLTALGTATVENFNGMAASSTANLPLGFKVGADWSTATNSQATQTYGTAGSGVVTSSSSGGIVSWGNGTNASSTDRALGFLNTGSFGSPRTVVVAVKNSSGSTINTLDVSWNYEKYRSGSRAWDWSFKHGDTSSPTNVLTAGDQSYAADADNTVVSNPPQSANKVVKLSNLNIVANGIYYLSWTLTGNGGSSNGQGLAIDDLSVTPSFVATPALGLSAPGSINEGVQGQTGTVTIPQALETALDVTVTTSDPTVLTVDPGTVTIPIGETSASFYIDTIADNQVTPDKPVTLTAKVSGYLDATAGITVKNLDLPRADFGASGFTSDFSGFTNGAASLPLGWSISGSQVAAYTVWTNSTTGTKYNTNAPFLFGYKHTASTGTVLQTLTLSNSTTETITALTVNYTGRANTNSTTDTNNVTTFDGRDPVYTVTVAGQASASLAYSTSEGDGVAKVGSVSGLDIPPGGIFAVVWSSDGPSAAGSGSRKTIGLSDVTVVSGATLTAPAMGGVAVDPFTLAQTTATVIGSVTGDGNSTLTERGFVYALSSVVNPVIDGVGVTKVTNEVAEVGLYTNTITGLTANTGYSVRAYAINGQGTNYSSSAVFTTLQVNPTFTGVYTQDFTGVSNAATIPAGWRALSSSNLNAFAGAWASNASSGGFYTRTGTPGILGYLHTSGSGIVTKKLTLVNGTGSTLTNLFVSYTGEVSVTNNTRFPAFTVEVNGAAVAALAYSTENGSNAALSTEVTGLNIETNATIVITWVSDRGLTGSGGSRMIGLTDVRVATSALTPAAPSNLSYTPSTVSGTVGAAISSLTPTVTGTVTNWSVSPLLPAGLSISDTTGVISGTPTAVVWTPVTNTVTASNAGGSTNTTVTAGPFVHFLESALGDFSGTTTAPTSIALGNSSKTLLGSVTGGSDSADYLTFTVPAGYRLDAVWLRTYQSTDNAGFMAIDEGSTWTAGDTTSAMLGNSHFGPTAVGADLLTTMGVSGSSLAAGTYTLRIQQLGAATAYGLEFELSALPTGSTFAGWSGGATLNSANVGKYAIGGASSLSATDGVLPSSTVSGGNLVLTAIVRTDDSKLTVVGEAVTSLANYAPGGTVSTVIGVDAADQTGVPTGCKRQTFTVSQGADSRKFIRLKATLQP